MELAPEKRQLLTQQHDEGAALVAALDQLQAEYHQELEQLRRQVRKKAFTHEITRARRYHEEKSFWEYLNNLVEDIHLFTWRKTATASCTASVVFHTVFVLSSAFWARRTLAMMVATVAVQMKGFGVAFWCVMYSLMA